MFGLADDMKMDDDGDISDGGDSDLEAELAAITSGGPARPARKPKPKIVPVAQLDALIAESLRDIPSDEELSGDDEDDPELLGELSELAGGDEAEATVEPEAPPVIVPTSSTSSIDLIKSRVEMYTLAESNAKEAGDSSRARRFNRGLKTLKDLLKQAEKGKTIDPSEIPPEVAVKSKPAAVPVDTPDDTPVAPPPVPSRTAPIPPPNIPAPILPTTSNDEEKEKTPEKEDPRQELLKKRKNEFQVAALTAKRAGDNTTALKYIKIVKQFEKVMEALKNGQEIDLSNMPTLEGSKPKSDRKEESEVQQQASAVSEEENLPEEKLITASTVLEALEQRLEKYQSQEKAAKDEGNSSKARRMGRICKQYQDAIKLHKLGKPVPFDELPTPPGYAPIPGTAKPAPPPPQPANIPQSPPASTPKPVAPKPSSSSSSQDKEQTRVSGSCKNTTLMDKQIAFLLERQREFKQAAIEAKKSNEIEQAKEYLRIYKGLENLLDTARGGFPIDMATVPIPPSKRAVLEDGFTFVSQDECVEGDLGDIRVRLEEQLCKQLMMCKNTRDHHKAMGDVAGTNRFENLALTTQKDLDFVRLAHKQNLPLPKFHYEKKSFNIVKCNTDLSDNEVEIHIVRGINYSVSNPKDVDTYVKVEFPWPQVNFDIKLFKKKFISK